MKTIVWSIFAVALAIWSLLAWGAHAFIDAAAGFAARNADAAPVSPETVEFLSWFAYFGAGVGGWLVIAVWAAVSSLMALGAYLITRFVPGSAQRIKKMDGSLNVNR